MDPKRALLVAMTVAALVAALGCADATAQGPAGAPEMSVLEGVVVRVVEDSDVTGPDGSTIPYQQLEVRLSEGPDARETVMVENGQYSGVNIQRYEVGTRLLLAVMQQADGTEQYFIQDVVRRDALMLLAVLFVLVTVAVGRLRGVASLISLAFTFLVIFAFVLPRIAAGNDPVAVAIAAAAVIIPVTFYLSHGIGRKTTSAVVGTLVALVLTGLATRFVVDAVSLTGMSSEDVNYLQASTALAFDTRGLLMASIVIGLLGILDDITVSQAAVVQQLRQTAPELSLGELVRRAMDVGTDHIASLVNTLILVYASSALPLLLLFTAGPAPVREIVNYEIVAEEIVRTLLASIGLITAVPISTLVAAMYIKAPEAAP